MPDTLSKLFGSSARVKLLRLFLFNPTSVFTVEEASKRARVSKKEAAAECTNFVNIKLVHKNGRSKVAHYTVSPTFPYIYALQNLLLSASAQASQIYERIKRHGAIKLVVVSGIFVGEWEGRVDLLIVADKAKEEKIQRYIKILESEVGREIRYALLSTQEFFYRLNMNDHLVRDVLDYNHRIMFDRLDIGLK